MGCNSCVCTYIGSLCFWEGFLTDIFNLYHHIFLHGQELQICKSAWDGMSHFDSMLTSFRNALSLTTENSRMSLAIKIPMVCVALLPADLKITKSCLSFCIFRWQLQLVFMMPMYMVEHVNGLCFSFFLNFTQYLMSGIFILLTF